MKLYTVSALEKVTKFNPARAPYAAASCLCSERFHFQVVAEGEEDVFLTASGDLAESVEIRRVLSLPGKLQRITKRDDYFLSAEDGNFPELLAPQSFDVAAAENRGARADNAPMPKDADPARCAAEYAPCLPKQDKDFKTFFITVFCKDGLKKGTHTIRLCEKTGGSSCTFTLNVIGAPLVENDAAITNWVHYDSLSDAYGVRLFSDEFYTVFDAFLTNYVAHGKTMLLVPLFTPPLDTEVGAERKTAQLVDVSENGGAYTFGFSRLKRFLQFADSHGVRYFEFSHLFTQWGAAACPKITATASGEEKRIFGWDDASDGDAYLKFLGAFLPAFTAFLEKENYTERSYLHLSDEPKAENLPAYKKLSDFVRPLIGRLKRIDALSHYEFYTQNLVDVPAVGLGFTKPFEESGANYFVYYCCSMFHSNVSNRFFQMPSQRNRILGFQMYANGVDGFLQWGQNFYNSGFSRGRINPYAVTDAYGEFSSGDAFVVYPYKGGVLDSIRHEVFLDAIQDYLALKTLERFIGREEVVKLLAQEGVTGFSDYPQSNAWHLAFREKINRLIENYVEGGTAAC